MALIPSVRALCPDTKLAHDFEQVTVKNVISPLRELGLMFPTPHRLVTKWREKYSDWVRLHQFQEFPYFVV